MGTLMKNRQVVGGTPVVDTALDTQSTDVVQNKVVAEQFSAINSTLGDKTEASAVTGDTAFAKISSLNNSLTNSFNKNAVKSVRLNVEAHTYTVTFNDYSKSALIFGNYSNSQAFMYIFGDGYCVPVKTASNVTVSLPSQAQGWNVFKLTTNGGTTGYMGIIDLSGRDVGVTIS